MTITELSPADNVWRPITAPLGAFSFLPLRTPWLTEADDLLETLAAHLPPVRHGDTVVVSEKVAVLLTGRSVPIHAAQPGRLATALARRVRPRQGSRGLSVPEKMQYVLDTVGAPRLVVAALVSAAMRPFGRHGDFYRIAGPVARDLDGGRPPYLDLLFPPLPPREARELVGRLERALGTGVAIVDLNDFGGTIRATSPGALPAADLLQVLAHNPLGQRSTGTPFGIVRPSTAAHDALKMTA